MSTIVRAEARAASFIYFVRAKDLVKIGIARNVTARIRNLQTGNGHALILLGVMAGTERDETHLHQRFAPHHVRGEWFFAHEDVVSFALSLPPLPGAPNRVRASRKAVAKMFVEALRECQVDPSDLEFEEALVREWCAGNDRRPLPAAALPLLPPDVRRSFLAKLLPEVVP